MLVILMEIALLVIFRIFFTVTSISICTSISITILGLMEINPVQTPVEIAEQPIDKFSTVQRAQPDRPGLVQVLVRTNSALVLCEVRVPLEHSALDFVIPRHPAQPLDVLVAALAAVDDVPDVGPAVLRQVFVVADPDLDPDLLVDADAQQGSDLLHERERPALDVLQQDP